MGAAADTVSDLSRLQVEPGRNISLLVCVCGRLFCDVYLQPSEKPIKVRRDGDFTIYMIRLNEHE